MATASPEVKKAKRSSTDSEPEALGSPTKRIRFCIICGHEASSKVVKNSDYDAMMQLYWCTLGVDVKPEACNKTDVCAGCFDKVVTFFEANDIILYFETYFKSLRLELLKKTLKGMAVYEKKCGEPNRIHQEMKKKYANNEPDITEAEEQQMRQTLDTYEFNTTLEDEDDSRVIKLSRRDASDKSKRDGVKISLKKKPESDSSNVESESESESDESSE